MVEDAQWEHGYRCHGLWRAGVRLGYVWLGAPGRWDGIYRWGIDARANAPLRESANLRAAKRAVEKALGLAARAGDQ
jgi:hypothetical protein